MLDFLEYIKDCSLDPPEYDGSDFAWDHWRMSHDACRHELDEEFEMFFVLSNCSINWPYLQFLSFNGLNMPIAYALSLILLFT